MLNSSWFFSKEGAAGCLPTAQASPSGGDVREVGLLFGVLFDRPDLRHLRPGLALGVLVGFYLHPAALAFDRLRSPASFGVDRPAVQDFGPLVRPSFGARRHRGPSADLGTDLGEPVHPAKPYPVARIYTSTFRHSASYQPGGTGSSFLISIFQVTCVHLLSCLRNLVFMAVERCRVNTSLFVSPPPKLGAAAAMGMT